MSHRLHNVLRRVCIRTLTLEKIALSLLLWAVAGFASGQPSASPGGEPLGPEQDDDEVEERPTLAVEAPDRQPLELEFPALTSEEIKITQTPQTDSGPLKVAFHRDIPNHIAGNLSPRLNWNTIGGSQYAYIQIRSPEAKTLRLELALKLPKGGSLRFYHVDSDGETRVGEKITQADIERRNQDTHWTTPVDTNHLNIEIRLPQGEDLDTVFIELKNLSHGYTSSLRGASTSLTRCLTHIQVPCAINNGDTTANTAASVAHLRYERTGIGYSCTGALISDVGQTTPYILTAAHCIESASVASTMTPVWFYEASSCGSLTSNTRVASTLGGGVLTASDPVLDISLVRLRNQPPSGTTYAAWDSTNTVPIGTDVIGLHHPQGLDKKFWKGSVIHSGRLTLCDLNGMNCVSLNNVIASQMSQGATEPGSSGSPVFLAGTNTIVGVHFASNGKCVDTIGFAGKFSAFYPSVASVLSATAATPDDHGNDLASATPISPNDSTQGSFEKAGDQDWFSFQVPADGDLTIYTRGTTNTAGRLLNANGSLLANDSGSHGGNFNIAIDASHGTHYVDVSAPGSAVGDYELITEFVATPVAPPPVPPSVPPPVPIVDDHGDDAANATVFSLNDSIEGSIEQAGDEDWFSFEVSTTGILTVYTTGSTNTVGRILDSDGVVLAEDDGAHGGNFSLTIGAFPDTFYVDVSATGNTTGDYLLITEYEDSLGGLLIDDHGNDRDTATIVNIGENVLGFIEKEDDVDFFRLDLNITTELILYTEGSLDTIGELQDEDGTLLTEDDDSGYGTNFHIESELEAGTYFIKVSELAGLTGTYVLHIETTSSIEPPAEDPGGGSGGDHGDTSDQATVVQVGSETNGTIDPASDVDFFKVDLTEPGLLTVYTSGPTDTYGRLSSADGTLKLRDDDDGRNYNFHISAEVHADTYFIEVTAYQDKTGEYVLHVEFEPWVLDLSSVSLTLSTDVVEEHDQNQVTVSVNTDEPVRKDEFIKLQVSGTATNAVDYTLDSSKVSVLSGTSQGTTTLTPYRDWIREGNETVEIEVVPPDTEPNAELAQVTLTIHDLFTEAGDVYQTQTGSDLIPLADLRGGQDTLTLITTIFNLGSEESEATRSVLSLHTSPEFANSDESMLWEIEIPRLDPDGGSYQQEFDVDLTELQPDTTYYARVQLATTTDGSELITDNNMHHFGFALDDNSRLKVSCEAPTRTSTSGNTDPLLPHQWNIKNTGQFTLTDTQIAEGVDLNMTQTLEDGLAGTGSTIAVIDTGLEVCHPDLHTNVDLDRSVNFRSEDGATNPWYNSLASDPFNPQPTGDHGTSIAGIIAAIENNGVGGRGVASKARIRGFNYLQRQSFPNLVQALGGGSLNDAADVAVLGFSSLNPTHFEERLYSVFGRGTRYGRNSRGTLFVKAAGNWFSECTTLRHVIHPEIGCRSANSDAINNIPYVLVVGAVDAQGRRASYSSSGSNLWISAPSGTRERIDVGMITTDQFDQYRGYGTLTQDVLWSRDDLNPDRDYTSTFIGTSGAAAQVAGAVALLLEVQPVLTFRDVKHILATTARTIEPDIPPVEVVVGASPYVLQPAWVTNAAGHSFHNSFGFGAIDVDAAVAAAENWQADGLGAFAVTKWMGDFVAALEETVTIPDHDGAGIIDTLHIEPPLAYITCDENSIEHHCISSDANSTEGLETRKSHSDTTPAISLEAVAVRLRISHPRMSDLGIHLISPSGTESVLNTVLNNAFERGSDGEEYLHFLSNAFYGEDPFGDWKLKIVDVIEEETGTFLEWDLRFYVGQRPQ